MPADLRDVLLETWAVNDAMNQLLLAHLNPKAWRAKPPSAGPREGRTIAAIFSHLHNTRVSWLRNSAPHLEAPALLNPAHSTIKQTSAALKKSSKQCLAMLTGALSFEPHRRVTKFVRDSYVQKWPAGGTMFAYMFSHEAHHRGQIILLAHQLGCRLPVPAAYGIWHWEKLWKQEGFKRPR
ncbi:MAG TPA: DinB family protein [Bryobacteraceae bacterium]|nr:DinB family protein [Bryobacteraceae bacterium]